MLRLQKDGIYLPRGFCGDPQPGADAARAALPAANRVWRVGAMRPLPMAGGGRARRFFATV